MYTSFLVGSIVALSVGRTVAAGMAWAGVNIGGFDFGCDTTGMCDLSKVTPPLHQYNGQDGAGQMKHFVDDDGLNVFRLPVGWQYLVNNQAGGILDATNFKKYDDLVKACLVTGAYCIIDIHNYARWNGEIIGQGGPKDEHFANLWSQLATKYAQEEKVVMGLMNEPHEIPDMSTWAASCQAAVTAIRKAGATTQHILLPGTGYTSAKSFVTSGSAAALGKVTNLDGSKDNLIFDVHKYLDSDNSGTHAACVSNAISNAFQPLATYLTQNKRVALVSEIGGGSDNPSCLTDLCQVADFLNENAGAYLGMMGWAAGSFDPSSYVLSLTPTKSGSTWTDQPLLTKCIAGKFSGSTSTNTTTPAPPSSGGSSSAPSSGGSSSAPPSGGSSSAPASGSSLTSVPAGGSASTPLPTSTYTPPTPPSAASTDSTGASAPPPTSTYTPPTSPSAASTDSPGGNVPMSYGGSMSWGLNSTASATGTGGLMGTSARYNQPTTMSTVVVSSSAQGNGGSSSSQAASAPPVSATALTGPGNNDGASVWGTKGRKPKSGSQHSAPKQAASDSQDCEVEYV